MLFKTKELQEQYRSGKLHRKLKEVILVIEILAGLYHNKFPDGITITSVYRPENKGSYHSKWQAVDIRTRDWTATFSQGIKIVLSIVNRFNRKLQFEFENHPIHLHIEFDDKSL